MKYSFALVTVVLLVMASQGAIAQDAIEPSIDGGAGDLPPGVEFSGEDSGELIPQPEPLVMGDENHPMAGSILGEPMRLLAGCQPAYFESSGTWLERGFWYTELDYVFLNRSWDRKGLMLAHEARTGTVPDTQAIQGFGIVVGSNELRVRGQRPGAEGNARVKLGRFLFRDGANRDHVMEFGYYGGGEWSQGAALQASTTAGIQVTDYIDRVNRSFDGARGMSFQYDSRLNSAEANYMVKSRMHRDQLVLQPSGEWVRAANPSRTYSFLAGVRYLNLRETLDWRATDVQVITNPSTREDGFYNVQTDNNMVGAQGGASWGYDAARWSITGAVKGGAFWNRIDLDSRFQVGETNIVNFGTTGSREDDLSFIGEFQFLGKWHLRPNLSLRASFEVMFIDSIALAPFQVNFIPGGFTPIAAAGDSVFLGSSLGVESYW